MPPKRMTANPVRPARYRPGKPLGPEESSSEYSESSESESEAHPPKPVYKAQNKGKTAGPVADVSKSLKNVDLKKRFDEGKNVEEARLYAEAQQAGQRNGASDDEYTTEEENGDEERTGGEEEDDDDDDDEEEEEEEEEAPRMVQLRPTFVPKSKRNAAISAAPDPEVEEGKKAAEEERKREEAADLLQEHFKRDVASKAAGRKGWDDDEGGDEGVDDTDGLDPASERAAWKLRELLRVRREREELQKIEKEREEIERRREMDPKLREQEDMEFVREQKKEKMEQRGKMGFLQKFYHKGAFYQDDEILKRNYATAAVEDSVKNREVLPKYMQVRGDELGKRGRTKWTHLTAEDTSMQAGGSPWLDKKKPGQFPPLASGIDDERFKSDREAGRVRQGDRAGRARGGGDSDRGNGDRGRPDDGVRRSYGDRSERRDRGGDKYVPRPNRYADDYDRDRKRPHPPRSRSYEVDKRQRRNASPIR
jgi:microfibrillar-associated protein 1